MKTTTIFSLLCAATLVFTACSDDKNNDPGTPVDTTTTYVGTLDVTPQPGSQFTPFSDRDITFEIKPADDGTYTLNMPKIKFVKDMPVYVSFEVRGLQVLFLKDGFYFEVAKTIPYRNGKPYDPDGKGTYTMYDLKGLGSVGGPLSVEFDCYTMHVKYNGQLKK